MYAYPSARKNAMGLKAPFVCQCRHALKVDVLNITWITTCVITPHRHRFPVYVTVCQGVSTSFCDRKGQLRFLKNFVDRLPCSMIFVVGRLTS
jgi:hypothetical protein